MPDNRLVFSGYADFYFQRVFHEKQPRNLASFTNNFRRNNGFGVNLALLKASWQSNKVKLNMGLMSGHYPLLNFQDESPLFQHIYEANFKVDFTQKLSVEAGVLPSHIGMESPIAKNCWNLSRSLLAENSPYSETGVKLNYQPNEMLTISALGLNGWQVIGDYGQNAFGSQIQFRPNDRWLLNFSTFYGKYYWRDDLEPRLFLNFYATYRPVDWLNLALLADFGSQTEENDALTWQGYALLGQVNPNGKWTGGFRVERFVDEHEVLIGALKIDGVHVNGAAVNLDWKPFEHFAWRLELRSYRSDAVLFVYSDVRGKSQTSFLSAMMVDF